MEQLSPDPLSSEIERSLVEVERSLVVLKQRYNQIQNDLHRQATLQQRQKELGRTKSLELQAELKRIKSELEEIEVNLESQLFSWGSLKEPFWQAVRFGGLGILIGWMLRSCVG
jgi:chromosome segregation ATPase